MYGCSVGGNGKTGGFPFLGAGCFTSGTAQRRVPNTLERPTPGNGKAAYLSYCAARGTRSPVGAHRNSERKSRKGSAATD